MKRLFLLVVLTSQLANPHSTVAQRRDSEKWEYVSAAAGITGALLLDRVSHVFGDSGFARSKAERLADQLGQPLTYVPALGAMYLIGRLTDSDDLADAGWHTAVALAGTQLAERAIKLAVGRQRPTGTDNPYTMRPLTRNREFQSFPSGHTVVAFTIAAALDHETSDPFLAAGAYSAAALVGWSRLATGEHWLSDVAGGAAVGIAVTQALLHTIDGKEEPSSPRPGQTAFTIGFALPIR
jgi:membrane-associated phospholipid phosphatase